MFDIATRFALQKVEIAPRGANGHSVAQNRQTAMGGAQATRARPSSGRRDTLRHAVVRGLLY